MPLAQDVARLRAFNRFYTRSIGVLVERPYGGEFSLTENRVLYELCHRDTVQPAALARELGLDPGYLSRILARFRRRGLIQTRARAEDRRSVAVYVTPAGRAAFAPLNAASEASVNALLAPLAKAERERALAGAAALQQALAAAPAPKPPAVLRDLAVGDIGWITARQGRLYHEEYGWTLAFEALVAELLADFVRNFDPAREQSWIAEQDGEIVGSVFLQKSEDPAAARLRLLYVEPAARGQGLGARLVQACIEGARARGCRRLSLWTNDILTSARRIYQAAGFRLTEENPHHSFGKDLVGQTWVLDLS